MSCTGFFEKIRRVRYSRRVYNSSPKVKVVDLVPFHYHGLNYGKIIALRVPFAVPRRQQTTGITLINKGHNHMKIPGGI